MGNETLSKKGDFCLAKKPDKDWDGDSLFHRTHLPASKDALSNC